jgi:hypothetical protein
MLPGGMKKSVSLRSGRASGPGEKDVTASHAAREKPTAKRRRRLRGALVFALLAAVTMLVYPVHNLAGGLSRDGAIYLYSGQQLLEGVPPYVSIFDHKGPLAPLLSGLGVFISKLLDTSQVITVRVVFMVCGSLAIAAVYFLSRHLLQSLREAVFSTLTFIGFFSFARYAVAEPEAKTPMLLFQTLSLLFTVQKRWFLAGICGSLTALIWQPMAVFALVTVLLAIARPGESGRRSAILRAVGGAATPVAVVAVCFYLWGALYELVNGTILFNLRYLDQEQLSVVGQLLNAAEAIFVGYSSVLVPVVIASMLAIVVIGFVAVVKLYVVRLHRIVADGAPAKELLDSRFAPLLLSLPFPVAWSLLDFQGYPDFYVFLPYIAVGFGGSLDFVIRRLSRDYALSPNRARRTLSVGFCAGLAAIAVVSSLIVVSPAQRASSLSIQEQSLSPTDLQNQRQAAREIEERYGEDARIVSIGVPQLLVLLRETNPNPYAFVIRGIDKKIAETTPGGFDGWLQELKSYDPDVIALGPTTGDYEPMLLKWLDDHYERERIGPWTLYVAPEEARH